MDHEGVLARLVAVFGKHAVQVVDGSGTLEQQVRRYRGARCQVGPHGAGLAMMLFAPDAFGTAEVTPGAYFVSIKGKPGVDGTNMHLNRNRNRTGKGVSQANFRLAAGACARGCGVCVAVVL